MAAYKIAFVLDDSLDTTDGVQQYVLHVGQWLSTQGHDVHYIVGHTERTDIPNLHSVGRNVKVHFNQNRMSMPLPVPRKRLAALLQKEQFDVVHVQMPYSPFLAGRLVQLTGPKTAVVGTFHVAPHGGIVYAANALLGLYLQRNLQRFDEIISVSKTAQEFAGKTFRVNSSVIPNTIDLAPFRGAEALPEFADATTIMFFGRLVERKGCQHFLKAIAQLHRVNALPPRAKVLVCGKGPLEGQLKAFVAENDLQDLVTFTGFVTEEYKPRYLASADLVVYPSTGGESFGIVLLEGMAASRGAVLAGDNPGYRGVMGDRPEALFDPKNPDEFAAKLKEYLVSPKLRDEARIWQRGFVGKFDLPTVGAEIVAAYDMALHKRRGS